MAIIHVGTLGSQLEPNAGSSLTITLTRAVPSGRHVTVAWAGASSPGPYTCQDSQGNTYTQDAFLANAAGGCHGMETVLFSAPVTGALQAGDTLTVTNAIATTHRVLIVDEWKGIDTTRPAIVSLAGGESNTSKTVATTATALTYPNEESLLLGWVVASDFAPLAPETFAPDAPWELLATDMGSSGAEIDCGVGDIGWSRAYRVRRRLTAGESGPIELSGILTAESLGPHWGALWVQYPPGHPTFSLAVSLSEDFDGIPAGGCEDEDVDDCTCDNTPTLRWTNSIDAGSFLYRWELRTGSATGDILHRGLVVERTRATMPELAVGTYAFAVSGFASDGETFAAATPYQLFAVESCLPGAADPGNPEADEIEAVTPRVPGYLRYYPQWLSCFGTDAQRDGSLLYQMHLPFLRELKTLANATHTQIEQASLAATPLNLPRQAWHLATQHHPREALTVRVRVSGGIVQEVERAASLAEFMTSEAPVFILGETGQFAFRNLSRRQITVRSAGATGVLAHRYVLGADQILPDQDVRFRSPAGSGEWYRIRAGSAGILPERATIQLRDPYADELDFEYASAAYRSTLQVSISGAPYRTPGEFDLWNNFDEHALAVGIRRRAGEHNRSLRDRTEARGGSRPGTHAESIRQQIAQDLSLCTLLRWDGRSTLSLHSSGHYGVRSIEVWDVPEISTAEEELIPLGGGQFHTSRSGWLPGWLVTLDGLPVNALRYPSVALSGHVFDFGETVTGTVRAYYRYRQYLPERSAGGFITAVTPATGALASGSYRVLLSRNVEVYNLSDPRFVAGRLLTPAGLPSAFFTDLRETLLAESPVHLARARWGPRAFWLTPSEPRSMSTLFPTVFDQISETADPA